MQAADFNPVLCFESQGDPSTYTGVEDNDFLLGIQTEFQKEMFENYTMKLICVDATHGTNSYDFQAPITRNRTHFWLLKKLYF